ncbi:hypothetical protein [Microbacterium sp. NPDC086615]|uniref:hypothetical protein n=1 Tax=Microbacterium sp. NPDC086615 TaxID=3154865 RepID=UPI003421DB71
MDEDMARCDYRWCQNDHTDPADEASHFEEYAITAGLTGRLTLRDGAESRTCELTARIGRGAKNAAMGADAIVDLRDGLTRLLDTYRSRAVVHGLFGLPTPRQVLERSER